MRRITLHKSVGSELSVEGAMTVTTFNKRKIFAKSSPLNLTYTDLEQISNLYHMLHHDIQTYPTASTAKQ